MNALKNRVQLLGNVGQEPEIKVLTSGKKVAKLSIATNEVYYNENKEKVTETQWHNVVAWGKIADLIENYVTKGKELLIEGKLAYRNYEDKEGIKRYSTEIIVSELQFIGK